MRKLAATVVVLPTLFGVASGAPIDPTGSGSVAPGIGSVHLVFGSSQGDKVVTYQTALPSGAIGKRDCSKALGERAVAFERAARRTNPAIADWRLLSVQCTAANDHLVRIVQRVPVKGAAADEE